MPALAHINARVEALLERIDEALDRSLPLKLVCGLWIAIAVPTFAVWMISQKNVVTPDALRVIIASMALLFLAWATLITVMHLRKKRTRLEPYQFGIIQPDEIDYDGDESENEE